MVPDSVLRADPARAADAVLRRARGPAVKAAAGLSEVIQALQGGELEAAGQALADAVAAGDPATMGALGALGGGAVGGVMGLTGRRRKAPWATALTGALAGGALGGLGIPALQRLGGLGTPIVDPELGHDLDKQQIQDAAEAAAGFASELPGRMGRAVRGAAQQARDLATGGGMGPMDLSANPNELLDPGMVAADRFVRKEFRPVTATLEDVAGYDLSPWAGGLVGGGIAGSRAWLQGRADQRWLDTQRFLRGADQLLDPNSAAYKALSSLDRDVLGEMRAGVQRAGTGKRLERVVPMAQRPVPGESWMTQARKAVRRGWERGTWGLTRPMGGRGETLAHDALRVYRGGRGEMPGLGASASNRQFSGLAKSEVNTQRTMARRAMEAGAVPQEDFLKRVGYNAKQVAEGKVAPSRIPMRNWMKRYDPHLGIAEPVRRAPKLRRTLTHGVLGGLAGLGIQHGYNAASHAMRRWMDPEGWHRWQQRNVTQGLVPELPITKQ